MNNIQDKISLRAYALKLAMERFYNDCRKTNEIIETADKFATYIQGGAKLPEFDNTVVPFVNNGFATINPEIENEEDDD